MQPRRLASITVEERIGILGPTEYTRSLFTVGIGDELCLLRGDDLEILHRWHLPNAARGWHGIWPDGNLALVSGEDAVTLLDREGAARWVMSHTPWSGSRESGCAWFDENGRAFAVIPDPDSGACLVVQIDLQTGQVRARAPIRGEPAGINSVPQAGWMGLSEGEGQDAARAWWTRLNDAGELETRIAPWVDQILADADPSGERILTTPHGGSGVLTVRTFPELRITRTIAAPGDDVHWLETACFAGDELIAQLGSDAGERTVAVDHDGTIDALEVDEGFIVGANHDSWLTAGRNQVARWSLSA